MKANELVIGDWVQISEPCKYHGAIGRIKTLIDHKDDENAYFKVFLQNNTIHIGIEDICSDDIRPIPLTPEILEKNGFITNDEQGNWKGYRIYSLFNTNKSCIFMLKLYEKDSIVEISLDMSPYYIVFKFVHQLQHALRLCGIEKEFEL